MVLPSISSSLRTGVIISCSIVPRSRSRTTPSAVSTRATWVMMIPISPGIMNVVELNDGLYRTSALTGGAAPADAPCRVASSRSAVIAVSRLDPSISTRAGRPSAPTTTATATRPCWMSDSAAAWSAATPGRTAKSPFVPSAERSSSESWPTSSAEMCWTSKLAA